MVEDIAVREVMTRDYVGVSESDTLRDAAELMLEEDQSAMAVLRGKESVGVVLDSQLLVALLNGHDPDDTRIDEVMRGPPTTLRPDTGIAEAAAVLADARTDHVFVRSGDELLGILSENDLMTAVTSLLTTESADPFEEHAEPPRPETDPTESNEMPTSQSVCESCGILKYDLEMENGQLLCSDCREV